MVPARSVSPLCCSTREPHSRTNSANSASVSWLYSGRLRRGPGRRTVSVESPPRSRRTTIARWRCDERPRPRVRARSAFAQPADALLSLGRRLSREPFVACLQRDCARKPQRGRAPPLPVPPAAAPPPGPQGV
eukprot:191980-Pleurochrysis_carterae.AAC.2